MLSWYGIEPWFPCGEPDWSPRAACATILGAALILGALLAAGRGDQPGAPAPRIVLTATPPTPAQDDLPPLLMYDVRLALELMEGQS